MRLVSNDFIDLKLKLGLHIRSKGCNHMVANRYFKLYRYGLVSLIIIFDISQEMFSICQL